MEQDQLQSKQDTPAVDPSAPKTGTPPEQQVDPNATKSEAESKLNNKENNPDAWNKDTGSLHGDGILKR